MDTPDDIGYDMSARIHDYIRPASSPNGSSSSNAMPQTVHSSFWERFKGRFQWENLVVNGKEVKGFVVTPAIAATVVGVMLSTVLGVMVWSYESNTRDSRDTLKAITRMETLLEERTRTFKEEQDKIERAQKDQAKEISDEKELAALQREKQNERIRDLETKRRN